MAKKPDGELSTVEEPQLPVSRFAALMGTADHIAGSELEKQLDTLIGVPFVITRVVAREGVSRPGPAGPIPGNYLSLELTVADQATLTNYVARGKIPAAQAQMIVPDSQMVINDGSTGIYRQVMEYLEETKRVGLPSGPDTGEMGTTRYDIHRDQWDYSTVDNDRLPDIRFNVEGESTVTWDLPDGLACPRGLRKSDYENSYGKATTYYLA